MSSHVEPDPCAWVMGMGEKEMRDAPCGPSLRRSVSGEMGSAFHRPWSIVRALGLDSLEETVDHSFSSNWRLDVSRAWLSFCRHGAPATLRTSACCL